MLFSCASLTELLLCTTRRDFYPHPGQTTLPRHVSVGSALLPPAPLAHLCQILCARSPCLPLQKENTVPCGQTFDTKISLTRSQYGNCSAQYNTSIDKSHLQIVLRLEHIKIENLYERKSLSHFNLLILFSCTDAQLRSKQYTSPALVLWTLDWLLT